MPAFPTVYSSPTIDVNGIPAAIYLGDRGDEGGIIETWTDRGLEVTIHFMVSWSNRIAFIQALRGSAGVVPVLSGSSGVARTAPFTLPNIITDFLPSMEPYNSDPYKWNRYICVGTDTFRPIKPRTDVDGTETGMTGWVYYEYVVIPARFAVTPYQIFSSQTYTWGQDLSGFQYTSVKSRSSGEVFQADFQTYVFKTSQSPVGSVGIIRPRQEYTITRYMMPELDVTGYDGMIGKVNDDEIYIGAKLYQAESMLYMGYEPEWVGDPSTGYLFCNIHHTILANGPAETTDGNASSSWNYAINRQGIFDQMVLKTDNKTPPFKRIEFKTTLWPELNVPNP